MVKTASFSFLLVVIFCLGINFCKSKYVGGYYRSDAINVLKPENINARLLTHLYYAFVTGNADGSLTLQNKDKGLANELLTLKSSNPDLKLLFSFVSQNGSLSQVVADKSLRDKFVESSLELVTQYKFDGIDLDWELPEEKDKENFVNLLKETRTEFIKHNYLITAAVRAIPIYKNGGYDVPELVKYLDIINVMTYDFYGSWSKTTGLSSPLYPSSLDSEYETKYFSIEASIKNWVDAGAPKEKLAVGLPFYARTFTLEDPAKHGIHAPSLGKGSPTALTYYQILENYQNYTTVWDDEQKGSYKYSNVTWLSYEDEKSISIKVKWAKDQNLKGVFVWHIGADDINGKFSKNKQPLLQKMNE